jgi:iron-sulfur cluster repair protein YtfE (RIC family)
MFQTHEATAHDDYLLAYAEITRKLDQFRQRLDSHMMKSKQHYMNRAYEGDLEHIGSVLDELLDATKHLVSH